MDPSFIKFDRDQPGAQSLQRKIQSQNRAARADDPVSFRKQMAKAASALVLSKEVPDYLLVLNRLFEETIIGQYPPTDILAEGFVDVVSAQATGDGELEAFSRGRLHMLADMLGNVRLHRPDVADRLLSPARLRSRDIGNHYGARAELQVANLLIDAGEEFAFEEDDKPDFLVDHHSLRVGIECTSCNPNSSLLNEGQISRKIRGTLSSKNQKAYADRFTLLFVDVSHLAFLARQIQGGKGEESIYTKASSYMARLAYGGLILAKTGLSGSGYTWVFRKAFSDPLGPNGITEERLSFDLLVWAQERFPENSERRVLDFKPTGLP